MNADIFFLYGSTVIIWGTTWLAIKFQLGSVDPMVSVLYRFVAVVLVGNWMVLSKRVPANLQT
jgi:hypothetical protein